MNEQNPVYNGGRGDAAASKPLLELLPVLYQTVELYLGMLAEDNRVTKYIKNEPDLSEQELVKRLLSLFPELG